MRRGVLCAAATVAALLFVFSGAASADVTLGTTTQPAGSTPEPCFTGSTDEPDVFVQATDDPATPYTVPAGGGAVTSWAANVSLDTSGASLTMAVLTPNGDGSYAVVGADTETIPTPIPSSGVATFTLATPIKVSAGDKLALYSSDAGSPNEPLCYWFGSSVPSAATLSALLSSATPSAGQTLAPDTLVGSSPPGYELALSATLAQNADLSLTKTASVSSVDVGGQISYTIKASNAGPDGAVNATVSDPLPADVSFVSASTTAGTCSGTSTVSCNLGTLASGGSATVMVVVKAVTAGTATNTASVSSSIPDSNMTNNSATATTTIVTPPPPPPPAKPKLKLSVSPHSAYAGQQRCYAFVATSSGKGVKGVTVKFAKHTGHTSSHGKVQICIKLKRGSYRASATKSGYVTAHATVTVKPAKVKKKAPTFTG